MSPPSMVRSGPPSRKLTRDDSWPEPARTYGHPRGTSDGPEKTRGSSTKPVVTAPSGNVKVARESQEGRGCVIPFVLRGADGQHLRRQGDVARTFSFVHS